MQLSLAKTAGGDLHTAEYVILMAVETRPR